MIYIYNPVTTSNTHILAKRIHIFSHDSDRLQNLLHDGARTDQPERPMAFRWHRTDGHQIDSTHSDPKVDRIYNWMTIYEHKCYMQLSVG